tara:strand:+ start:173 stop:925 length:753 start_codon:yes stop_codon:yes gene_type:complete
MYMPNKGQEWLWNNWEEAWAKIKSLKRKHRRAKLHLVLNGDLTDGDHHRTTQIATGHEGVHVHCAMEVLRVPLALKPDSIHILRGTPAHVGRAGGMEEGLAKALKGQGWKVVEDPDTGNASSYHRLIKFGGLTFDVKHHGRMGRRAHTKGPYIRWYAQDIFFNYLMDGEEAPDLAIRSHFHQFADSGKIHKIKTRAVALPAWQLATEYVHRVAESLADVGLVWFEVDDDDDYTMSTLLFKPERPTTVEVP